MEGVVVDTNVFVAAAFNPESASAAILAEIRGGRLRLIWNKPTRAETTTILRRIPRLDGEQFTALFRPDGEFDGPLDVDAFRSITDPDDRKFAALSAAAKVPLVTSDNHLLVHDGRIGVAVLTPRAFIDRLRDVTDQNARRQATSPCATLQLTCGRPA